MIKVKVTFEREFPEEFITELEENPIEYVDSDPFAFLDHETSKVIDVKIERL